MDHGSLGDSEDRGVRAGAMRDAQRIEASEKLVWRQRRSIHGGTMALFARPGNLTIIWAGSG
ncbi:MAG TPA: hypothetical protein VGM07_05060 [Stellaceae bacterium]|jgi:hypothetical protein